MTGQSRGPRQVTRDKEEAEVTSQTVLALEVTLICFGGDPLAASPPRPEVESNRWNLSGFRSTEKNKELGSATHPRQVNIRVHSLSLVQTLRNTVYF